PADKEELGETGSLDDIELVGEPVDDRRRQRVVALSGARPAQLRQVRERRLPTRDGEAGEPILLEPEVDRAPGRELTGRSNSLSPGPGRSRVLLGRDRVRGRQPCQLLGRLQVVLARWR